jgi:Trk-type K+ transport system membrane component
MKYRSLTNFFLPLFLILFLTSCADIIDAYYLKNPDDRGVLYNIVNWFKWQADERIRYTLIITAIILIILGIANTLSNAVDWFKNLFNKK